MHELAIVALTPNGLALGRRLAGALGHAEALHLDGDVRIQLGTLFQARRPLVCVMALGIVVRILGPLAQDKEHDPPVVVVDEAGRFAISVLGGHRGGANELARQVAAALGATPVITTASEALGLPAVDLIGRDRGWTIEHTDQLTAVAGAVVRGEPVAVYQDAGARDWHTPFGAWPAHFMQVERWPAAGVAAGLVISDREVAVATCPTVIYRPRTLALGVGCKRGVPFEEIDAAFERLCATHGFSPRSLAVVATVSLKAKEPGLVEFAARRRVPLQIFRVNELAEVENLPTPSARVQAKIGIPGVAEPAALLAAGTTTLLVPKMKGERLTMALARREEP